MKGTDEQSLIEPANKTTKHADKENIYETPTGCCDRKFFFDTSLTSAKKSLFRFVLATRFAVFLVQLMFNGWNFTTDAFRGLSPHPDSLSLGDVFFQRLLRGFRQWDAVHMMHIAEHGYQLETSLAFFPLFPFAVRYLSYWAWPLTNFHLLHTTTAHLITAVILNTICFCVSARLLFSIVYTLSCSNKNAFIACIVFAVNPASIFFSSAYTESMYSMFTFAGISMFLRPSPNFFLRFLAALFFFSLAYITRSNGLINLGYVGFFLLLQFLFRRDDVTGRRTTVFSQGTGVVFMATSSLLMRLILSLLAISLPVYLHGNYQQTSFCSQNSLSSLSSPMISLARRSNVPTIGQPEKMPWCNLTTVLFPAFYSSVQSKYWHVSIFGYWQLTKLPCLLLASPALLIVAFGVIQTIESVKKSSLLECLARGGDHIPYTLHAVFLALTAVFVYNVEVLTRMLFSSSPFPYLVLAKWMADITPRARLSDLIYPSYLPFLSILSHKNTLSSSLFYYFLSYFIVGSAMHAMGLPFT